MPVLQTTGQKSLAAVTAALLAALAFWAAKGKPVLTPAVPKTAVWYCSPTDSTLMDSATTPPSLVKPIRSFKRGTTEPMAWDTTRIPAPSDTGYKLQISVPCYAIDRDTSAAHREQMRVHDSLMVGDSLKWTRGDTMSLSTDRDYWHTLLGNPGKKR